MDSLWAPTGARPVQKTETNAFKMLVNPMEQKKRILCLPGGENLALHGSVPPDGAVLSDLFDSSL